MAEKTHPEGHRRSLANSTDLIFSHFSGEVKDEKEYTYIKTRANPGYHWGNYLILNFVPSDEDFSRCMDWFAKEFSWINGLNHRVFTWDQTEPPKNWDKFKSEGFSLEESKVLFCDQLVEPPNINDKIAVRNIETDQEWEEVVRLQTLTNEKYETASYLKFKQSQMAEYRKMTNDGLGNWYGAYLDGVLVGDLGIFHNNDLARFQSVETHPSHRNLGICRTLVYQSANLFKHQFNLSKFVMVADAEYHAARIYEMVGFKPVERNYALYFWRNENASC